MTPAYLHTDGRVLPKLPEKPHRMLLIAEIGVETSFMEDLAAAIEASGCLYFMAWGEACARWDDEVDVANLAAHGFEDVPSDKFIMTTWHGDEPLSEAMWFAQHCALRSYDDRPLPTLVLLHLAATPNETGVAAAFRSAVDGTSD